MSDQVKYTVDEFDHFTTLPENAGRRFELIDGEIIEKMPTLFHAAIISALIVALSRYLENNPFGWILPEARFKLPDEEGNAHILDLSFVRKGAGRTLIKEGAAPFMPDLAIEVQSPGQSDQVMLDKANYYLQRGSKMVWLIYPEKLLVELFTPDDRQLLTLNALLDGGDVLPGFQIAVKDIFPTE